MLPRFMRRVAAIALVAAGMALGACGGDDGDDKKSADAYATDFCSAAQTWVDALRAGAGDLSGLGSDATPKEGKDALEGFFEKAVSDTEKFSDELDSAGVPDVEGGEDAANELKTAIDQAKEILERALEQTGDLPVDSEQRFSVEARKVGNSTRDSLGKVGDAIAEPRSSELQTALRESPGCRRLGNNN